MAGMELRRVVYPRLLLLAVWCLIAASCSSATTDVVSDEDSVPEEVLTDPVDGSDEQDADDPDVDDEDEVVEDEVVGDDDDEDEVVEDEVVGDDDDEDDETPVAPEAHRVFLAARALGSVPDNAPVCSFIDGAETLSAWSEFRDATASGDLYAICGWIEAGEDLTGASITNADGTTFSVELEVSDSTVIEGGVSGQAVIARNGTQAQFVGMTADMNDRRLVQMIVFVPLDSTSGGWEFSIDGKATSVDGALQVEARCTPTSIDFNPFFWSADLENFGNDANTGNRIPTHEDNCRISPDFSGRTLVEMQSQLIPALEQQLGLNIEIDIADPTCTSFNAEVVDALIADFIPSLIFRESAMESTLFLTGFTDVRCRRTSSPSFSSADWEDESSSSPGTTTSTRLDTEAEWDWSLEANPTGQATSLLVYHGACWRFDLFGPIVSLMFEINRTMVAGGTDVEVSEQFVAVQDGQTHILQTPNPPVSIAGVATASVGGVSTNDFNPPLDNSLDASPACFGISRSVVTETDVQITHTASDFRVTVEPELLPTG